MCAHAKIFHFLVTGLSINIYVASQFDHTGQTQSLLRTAKTIAVIVKDLVLNDPPRLFRERLNFNPNFIVEITLRGLVTVTIHF